jgi:ribosomal protein L24E
VRARLSRTDICTFSNYRIYPYHGVTYIRVDGKVCSVCVALVLQLWWRRGEGAQEGMSVSLLACTRMPIHAQQSFRFINGKNEACFHMKRNPRKINWTLFYRRLRKKGTQVQNPRLFSLPLLSCLSLPAPPREPLRDAQDNVTLDRAAGARGFGKRCKWWPNTRNSRIHEHRCFQLRCSIPTRLALSVEHWTIGTSTHATYGACSVSLQDTQAWRHALDMPSPLHPTRPAPPSLPLPHVLPLTLPASPPLGGCMCVCT